MNRISTPKATVCVNNTCVKVQGKTAQIVNVAVTVLALVTVASAIYKLLK